MRESTEARDGLIRATYKETGSIRRSAKRHGVSFGLAKRAIDREPPREAKEAAPYVSLSDAESSDGMSRSLDFKTRRIVTVEDAIAHGKVDTSVWRVKSFEMTAWEVGMKLATFDGKTKLPEEPSVLPLWRVSLKLERILPRCVQAALDAVLGRLEAIRPTWPKPETAGRGGDPHLAVLGLVDCHFGKLAWAAETEQDYDIKIAESVYRNAVIDMFGYFGRFDIEEILIPIGSDFLHVDNSENTTTKGTRQDVDGRLAKIIEAAEMAVIFAVEYAAARSKKVVVQLIPGNHDGLMSLCLARTIQAYFRNAPSVAVDCGPKKRKYHRFGKTLIGMTHGDKEKHDRLPGIMGSERRDMGECTTREWLIGHRHKAAKLEFMSLDTYGGIPVRTLPSLSAVDAWHFENGYVGSTRAADVYLYSKTRFVGMFQAQARD